MEYISFLIDLFIHLDKHLSEALQIFGAWTYILLFAIIFMETGLVFTPFLPGDSLLFAAGSLTALPDSPLHVVVLFIAMAVAAILGDTANYWIGHAIGPRAFTGNIRFLKKEYLDRTHAFYEKHGGKTIVIARFIPIIRTFAPFVAGIGAMSYGRFIAYNMLGGIMWTALFIFVGYFFGNLPIVQHNFSLVIIVIIILSMLPGVYEFIQNRRETTRTRKFPPGSNPAPIETE